MARNLIQIQRPINGLRNLAPEQSCTQPIDSAFTSFGKGNSLGFYGLPSHRPA